MEKLKGLYEAKQNVILGHKQDSAIDDLKEEGDRRRKEFERRWVAGLKGSVGDGPNQTNYSDQSLVRILAKFRNFR